MRRIQTGVLCAALFLGPLAALVGCSGTDSASTVVPTRPATSSPGSTVAVQKDTLGTEVDPPGAPGRTLTLMRYTIAPGAKLSPHIHPGVQLARIESGSLTYTIVSGTVIVTRVTGAKETVTGPTTIGLSAGDTVAENDGMVHFGANDGTVPVVILASLLTESDKDLAVTVSVPTSGG